MGILGGFCVWGWRRMEKNKPALPSPPFFLGVNCCIAISTLQEAFPVCLRLSSCAHCTQHHSSLLAGCLLISLSFCVISPSRMGLFTFMFLSPKLLPKVPLNRPEPRLGLPGPGSALLPWSWSPLETVGRGAHPPLTLLSCAQKGAPPGQESGWKGME